MAGADQESVTAVVSSVLVVNKLAPFIVGFCGADSMGLTGPVGRDVVSPTTIMYGEVLMLGADWNTLAASQNVKKRGQATGKGSP